MVFGGKQDCQQASKGWIEQAIIIGVRRMRGNDWAGKCVTAVSLSPLFNSRVGEWEHTLALIKYYVDVHRGA